MDLMSLIKQAGFTGAATNTMYGIVMAESGGHADSHNTNAGTGDNSYGLAQINMLGEMGPARLKQYGLTSNEQLFDPLTNLKVAYKMSGGGTHFGDWSTYNSGAYLNQAPGATVTNAGGGGGSASGGGNAGMSANAVSAPTLTPAQKKAELIAGVGPLAGLLTSIPELAGLLSTAISTGQTAAEFQNAVDNSKWYRTHSDTVRTDLAQQASDPAAWTQKFNHTVGTIHQLAAQNGITISAGQDARLAHLAMSQGFDGDTAWLTKQVAAFQDFTKLGSTAGLRGNMASAVQQLKQLTGQYGQNWGENQYAYRAQQILEGKQTLDSYKQSVISAATAMYPGLTQEIQGGKTVQDVAQPYYQTMSNLLETDQNAITLNDPMIKKALQGAPDPKTGMRATTPLWQFEQQVKSDPRWNYTKNAHADTSALLEQLGHAWGYSAA